jgi:hypothetical protein
VANQRNQFNPVHAFGNAKAFFNAANAIKRSTGDGPLRLQPAMVCIAFSLEVLLKCLHHLRGRHYDQGRDAHNVQFLFGKLDSADKKTITDTFDSLMKQDPSFSALVENNKAVDIDSVLARASELFVTMRYCHEGGPLPTDSQNDYGDVGIGRLVVAVKDFILQLHPEYEQQSLAPVHSFREYSW